MWYTTTYQQVSLTSLKLATATSTGGKSLLLPTPFAVKMALLDIIIRTEGVVKGEILWSLIRDGRVAVSGPRYIAVTNTFTKILKPMKGKPSLDLETGLTRGMIKTIGFREYVYWQGNLSIAFAPAAKEEHDWLQWLTLINYIGKRGGFIQPLNQGTTMDTLPSNFVRLGESITQFPLKGTLQVMDDCSSDLTFEQINIYSGKNMRTGKNRLLRHIVLPYRAERSSRGYTLYQRIG